MTRKELAELRRHFRLDRVAVQRIYGCYVNANRQIIAYIDEPLSTMAQNEQEKYLGLLKKSLSGGLGRNLVDIVFSTQQVAGSEEHGLLMELRTSKLQNKEARDKLYDKIISALDMGDSNYVILLVHDSYDIPRKNKDGSEADSEDVYNYILCAVCPTKDVKPELQFFPGDNEFHSSAGSQVIVPTELGFLFPAFDDRAANIYNAIFYTRNASDTHSDVIDALFHVDLPMSAGEQREAFESALSDALGDECGFETVQALNDRMAAQIREHKEEKDPEPLAMTAGEVGDMLTDMGVSGEAVERFKTRCGETLGEGAVIKPENVIDEKKFVVKTDELTVSVSQEESFRLESRVIDGRKYLLIPVGATVEINGMETKI